MLVYKSVLSSSEGGGLSLDNLEITHSATKDTYIKGDPIDLSGLVVTGTLGNMQGDVTSDCTVSPSVFNTLGTQTVTLSYGGLSVSYDVVVTSGLRIVPWATGTDLEIVAMLNAFYNDELDIYSCDGWNIGAEREVQLSAMPATGVSETHVAQTAKLVLLDRNVRDLVTPINGHTKCAFVVGQGNVLKNGNTLETGYMHSSNIDAYWEMCDRRTWCNNVYKNAFPETLRSLFKEFVNPVISKANSSGTLSSTNDYFSLPSVNEIMPELIPNITNIQEGSTLSAYVGIGKENYPRNKGGVYWFRTSTEHSTKNFLYGSNTGYTASRTYVSRDDYVGFAPFGVI